jgi:hypothetical protein
MGSLLVRYEKCHEILKNHQKCAKLLDPPEPHQAITLNYLKSNQNLLKSQKSTQNTTKRVNNKPHKSHETKITAAAGVKTPAQLQ